VYEVGRLPCGWTFDPAEEAMAAYRVGDWLPLRLSRDRTRLHPVGGGDAMSDTSAVAAAAHLVHAHPDDERVAAAPVEFRNVRRRV
jgi:hypothetical protein